MIAWAGLPNGVLGVSLSSSPTTLLEKESITFNPDRDPFDLGHVWQNKF